jgi:6-hydroxytryprostatin B O-methyltransferase
MMILHAVVRFGIAEAVPLDEPVTFEAIAKKVGLSTDRVTRLLRHGITNNLFEEPRPGYVAHTGLSSIIVREPLSKSWALHNFEEVATTRFIDAYDKFGESEEPTETANHIQFDYYATHPKDNVWKFFENDGEGEKKGYRMRRFAEAMVWAQGYRNDDDVYLTLGFDWASLGEATIVDVSFPSPAPAPALRLTKSTRWAAP